MVNVYFEPTAEGAGVEAVDAIQRHRYTLTTPSSAQFEPADPEEMLFPVDSAIALTTSRIELLDSTCVYVRDADGGMLASTEPPSSQDFPDGEYYLEICTPIKLYARVSSPISIEATVNHKSFDFGDDTTVLLGGRSKHEFPEGTVTTTSDPADVMAAISTFGSALKTTSPERSFPTLRGHPPTIELGEELDVPADLAPPETGVRIEIPPTLRHAYVVSTLAYYLGATVVPGKSPRLVTDSGFVYNLAPDFEGEVERVLKGAFLLDCVVRTEGLYDIALTERHAVEPLVDLDFAALYQQPLSSRLESYLTVPYDVLAPHVPEWKLTAHVDDGPTTVETLPFVVDDLAVVRTGPETAASTADAGGVSPSGAGDVHQDAIDSFTRAARRSTQGWRSASAVSGQTEPVVAPGPSESMAQAWIGNGVPFGASKVTADAYWNRLDRTSRSEDVEVTVVCNDLQMVDERRHLDDVYGNRAELPFEVVTHERLSVDELRDVLAAETALFHYIGHIDDRGFECTDGSLDAATIEETGVEAFLLNACQSYHQGMALVSAGAIGGIVTLEDVVNAGAVDVGYTLGRLLNNGYPLSPAMDIARRGSYIGQQYIVVGDGGFAFVPSEGDVPCLRKVNRSADGFEVEMMTYASPSRPLGSITIPNVDTVDEYSLHSGPLDAFTLAPDELLEFLKREDSPTVVDGDLYWNEELDDLEL